MLPLLFIAGGCQSEPPPSFLPWMFGKPRLRADELVPGTAATLRLSGVPEGSEVAFLRSTVGLGRGFCEPDGVTCAEILDPELFGVTTAGPSGAQLDVLVPPSAEPGVVYLQAEIYDPATGATTFSTPVARHVHIRPSDARVLLTDGSAAAGLAGVFTNGNSHTGGIAWLDYNGDLWPDLFVANGSNERHRLFRNDGDGTFTEVSSLLPKPDRQLESAGTCFADLENDGDVDLLVVVDRPSPLETELAMKPEGGPNLLYINQGDGTFTQEARQRGILDPRGWRNITCAFGDFDADGFVDVHLGAWILNVPGVDNPGRLLRNDGTGRFREIRERLGHGRDVLATVAADLDGDGWTDLYLGHVNGIGDHVGSNPEADDVLYLNAQGSMVEATARSPGVGDDAWAAMGIDIADVDNDGDFDLYETDRWDIPDALPRGNPLYLGRGDGTFEDNSCDRAGICTTSSTWPASFADFDRDGWVDLYVGTTFPADVDLLYLNRGDGTFDSHLVEALEDRAPRGGAVADYDGDGDVDLFTWNLAEDSVLYVNEPRDQNDWVEIKLIGRRANREAIGAVIRLTTESGLAQLRRVSGGDSAHSQSESIVHFGLGQERGPVDLEILWPGGERQRVEDLSVGRLWLVDQALGALPDEPVEATARWSRITGELRVVARTTYGGRSAPWVEGHALAKRGSLSRTALTWNAEAQGYEASLPLQGRPPERVNVGAADGAWWSLPVLSTD